jgi:hypothetical protein
MNFTNQDFRLYRKRHYKDEKLYCSSGSSEFEKDDVDFRYYQPLGRVNCRMIKNYKTQIKKLKGKIKKRRRELILIEKIKRYHLLAEIRELKKYFHKDDSDDSDENGRGIGRGRGASQSQVI